ncbi:MAG: ABC transporter permease [Oscillospiraceae bacterium]|nr:ABC transporter permease [Oscillospiraceae bacterium]
MRVIPFAKRTLKEILRDPLTLFFGLGFPCVLILLLSAIQVNIPVELFAIELLAPGMTVFGLAFMTLFSASLIAKDRESALFLRLYATPMRAVDFILGYTLPMLPIALAQSVFCFVLGAFLGMQVTVNMLGGLLCLLPVSLFFIGMGLLFGSILNQKQVGGICGALLTNLTAWLSGIWFDLDLVGGTFKKVAEVLPFYHGVKLVQAVIAGQFNGIGIHLAWVLGYVVVSITIAVVLFLRQMRKQ